MILRATSARFRVTLLCLLALVPACRRASSEPSEPKGGDGKAALAALDRNDPDAGVIVVLGSSTAAGAGASSEETSWVPRYRADLAKRFPKLVVVNLARGGYTTFELQPTGYVPPAGRPLPAPENNIDAALALAPRAIIINLPSNDQAARYPWSEQLANYERVAAAAQAARVALWITTTQPRNFEHEEQRRHLVTAREAILARFAPRVADFYTPLATSSGRLRPAFDSGDGTHVNDAGHALLAQAIIHARIPNTVLTNAETAPEAP